MTNYRTRQLVSSWLTALLAIALLPFISAPEAEAAPNNKATICHRTKSITNPYRLITVSRNSISGNNGHAGHKTNPTSGIWTPSKVQGDNWEDIIPGDLNWSTSGAQDIYYGRTRTAAGIPVCRSMTFSQFYKSEKDAGRTDAQIAADLDDGMSDEDKAVLKTFGGSSCTTFAGCSTSLTTISNNSKTIAAVTTYATSVTSSGATLNGYVKADSNSIRYYFEYSTDGTWSTEPTKVPSTSAGPVTSDTTTAVSYNLTGLNSGTTYYYRIVAEYTPTGGTLQEVSGDLVSFEASDTQKYVIRYESNGGTDGLAPVDTKLYPGNSAAKVLANYGNLTKNGRAFTGWSLSPGAGLIAGPSSLQDLLKIPPSNKSKLFSPLARVSFLKVAPIPQYTSGTYSGGSDITVESSDITLYAQYEAAYTVTYSLNGGSGTLPTESDKASGAVFTLAASSGLTKEGYTFSGWNDGSTTFSAGASYTMPASNVTLTAQWTANALIVTYDSQGGSSVANGSTTSGGSISSSPGNPTRTGYSFDGWFVASSGGTPISFSYSHGQTSNFTLYAQWTASTYTVTYNGNSNDGGSEPANQTKTHDISLTLATNSGSLTRSGYTFNGWNTAADGSGTSYATGASYTTNAGLTLYARWTAVSSGGSSEPVTPPPPPGPIISSLSASDLCAISSDLTIYGSNFGDAKVTFDGAQVTIKTTSATTIDVTLPTSSLGKKTLIVTTPNGAATAYVNYLTASKPKFQPIRIPYLSQGSLLSLDLLADDALRFRLSGSLPSGVTFNESTGLLSGTPTENGVFVFNVVAIGVCGETTSVLELDVDAPTPNAMSHRINFLPGSCVLSDSAKASFEEFITKIKGLSPRNIIPEIYISGGSKNSDPNSPIAQCRQESLCDLLLIEDLTGDVLTDVFTGSENRIEVIVYWPRPNDDL